MSKQHHYTLKINWTGNTGRGTENYAAYERSHELIIAGKKKLNCSSDSPFRGDKTKHNPEDMLLYSLAACHMLWYLHLCADKGIVVLSYTDEPRAKMIQTSNGSGYFTEAVLNPRVVVQRAEMVKKAIELHKEANSHCFIANSVKFPVYHKPEVSAKET